MSYFIQGEHFPVVYCANKRVGSTAISNTLQELGAEKITQDHHDGLNGFAVPSNSLIVETVRHHCDVIVSFWYKSQQGRTLEDFVELILDGKYEHLDPEGFYNKFGSNYIMRYESIQHEFDNLCITAGLPVTELLVTKSNRPKGLTWDKVMGQHLVDKVCKRYKHEMELYGYGSSKQYQ